LKAETPTIDYTEQIRSRLSEVYAMHPYLEYYAINENIDDLLEKIKRMEIQLRPPFSVWLHGDFNINNIIYNEGLVKFIDVHRSNYGDYLCDVGVFMVSTIRHAPGREAVLEDMTRVREIVTDRIAGFAKEQNDCNWEPRLRLSLARSYITSARVIIDEMQARTLFETGLILLKKEVNR
jgi:thiamine kinase-like enzyme